MPIIYSEKVRKEDLDPKLRRKLDLFDIYCDIEVIATRGYSDAEKNALVGGVKNSSHIKRLAIDISCDNGVLYAKIKKYAGWAGFTRFGHGEKHIHLDCDLSKAQNCEWWEK